MASTLDILLSCFAAELNRLDNHLLTLIRNGIPGLSDETELLPDWETDLGLPEECFPLGTTQAQRRLAAHSKYTTKYTGLSEQFFIDLAQSYGATITITQGGGAGTPFRAGSAIDTDKTRVGPTSPVSSPDRRVWSAAQLHVWIVNIAGSEPNLDLIICVFNKMKPAHTLVQFNIS